MLTGQSWNLESGVRRSAILPCRLVQRDDIFSLTTTTLLIPALHDRGLTVFVAVDIDRSLTLDAGFFLDLKHIRV
jgi:hypothetical protein